MSQRTSSGNDSFNEFGEKIMNRLATSETNLLVLGVLIILDRKNRLKIKRQLLN